VTHAFQPSARWDASNNHRDEDYKIVKLRDDLISAARYAFMMRRSGKLLDTCEPYNRAPGVADIYDPRPIRRDYGGRESSGIARGTDFNVFTGQ
jgi:hypothetical protein